MFVMNGEWLWIWEQTVVAYLKVVSSVRLSSNPAGTRNGYLTNTGLDFCPYPSPPPIVDNKLYGTESLKS
jgi:hypothetical protein